MVSPYLMRPMRSLEEVEREKAEAKAAALRIGPPARAGDVQPFRARSLHAQSAINTQRKDLAQPR